MIAYLSRVRIGQLETVVARHREAGPNVAGAAVICHGFGAPGDDLVSFANEMYRADLKLRDTIFVFPAAPLELDPNFDSRAWWPIDMEKLQQLMMQGEVRELRHEVPERLDLSRQLIDEIIDLTCKKHSIERSQVVVGGFSQGSMLATDVMLNSVEPLGGLIVWSGTLLNEDTWSELASRQTPIAVVQSHGTLDPILPFSGAELLRDKLNENGFDVQFLPFVGQHQISQEAIDAGRNLIAQVAGTPE